MKLLVSHGCDPFEVGSLERILLHIAVGRGFLKVVQYLLSLGGSPATDLLRVEVDQQMRVSTTVRLHKDGVNIPPHTLEEPVLHATLSLIWDENEDEVLDTVKLLVGQGCNPLEVSPFGETPLHIAVKRGLPSVAQYLLSLGISPSPDLLRVALESMSRQPKAPIVGCLLENGANVHADTTVRDPLFCTALSLLWDDDDGLNTAKLLVRHGCDPLEVNSSGETPLHIAVKRGFPSVVQYLLSLGLSPSPDLLHHALESGHSYEVPTMVGCLLENGANVRASTTARDPLLCTALLSLWDEDDVLKTAKLLVRHGCDPLEVGSSGKTPLYIAVKRGFPSVVQYLLSLGLSPSPDLLHLALELENMHGAPIMVGCLLENGANVRANTTARDPLLCTALSSSWNEDDALNTAKLLVRHGCDPLEVSSSGETPLHVVVKRGFLSIVQYLLSLGIPPPPGLLHVVLRSENVRVSESMHYQYPLKNTEYALERYALDITKLLVCRGCDPLESDTTGETPLHIAVERGLVSVAIYLLSLGGIPSSPNLLHVALRSKLEKAPTVLTVCLLENGADVHARTTAGDSVLHTALRSSSTEDSAMEIAKVLICHGCDLLAANDSGETPLHIAVERGFVSVTSHLLSLGVTPSSDMLFIALLSRNQEVQSEVLSYLETGINMPLAPFDPYPPHLIDLPHPIDFEPPREGFHTLEILKLLTARGCNLLEPNSRGEIPLCIAVEQGHITIAKILFSLFSSDFRVDVLWAVLTLKQFRPKTRTIEFLVDEGVDILAKTQNGDSVLHVAVACVADDEVLQVVTLLVRRGCDPTIRNTRGITPFHVAVQRGRIAVVKLFLESLNVAPPLDILSTSMRFMPALTGSASDLSQRLEVIKVLVASGCAHGAAGQTSLDVASSGGHVDTVD